MVRNLNKRERLLAISLAVVLTGIGLLVFQSWSAAHIAARRSQLATLRDNLAELNRWVSQEEFWLAKGRWLDANHPPAYRAEDSKSAFVEWSQKSSHQAGLAMSDLRLTGESASDGVVEVGISLVLTGRLEQLVRWMHQAQDVGTFREIRNIKVTSDADNSKVRAEVLLVFLSEMPSAQTAAIK